ncbi:MAG: hypothetical protein ACKVK5_10680 [Pseudomonadales bacterium]
MASIQEQLVAQAKAALLAADTPAADRVFRSRSEALRREEVPAIVIRPDMEQTERESEEVDRCQFELSVEILARESADGLTPWDTQADAVKVAVHAALMAENVFPQADRVQRFYVDWVEEEGDNTAGNCMVRYRFTYLCSSFDLGASPTYY